MYLEETEPLQYEPPREAWVGWASLTSVLLALAAAAMSFAAAHWGVQAYLCAQRLQGRWADYQALASKVEALHYSRDFFTLHQLLEHKNPKLQEFIEEKLRECDKEAAGLNEGWEHFKVETNELERQGEHYSRRVAGSVRTAFLLFVAVVLAAFGGVGKKKLLWLSSLVLTGIGAISFLGGVLLWF
uniref:DUF4337 family protein n=1 Tax=Desulfobacca acetoxidans TaxID=60893 RepID=A0A7C3V636_9BACT